MIMLCEIQLDKDASDWSTWIFMINLLSDNDNDNNVNDGDCDDDADDNDDDDDNYVMMIIYIYLGWITFLWNDFMYV